MKNKLYNYFAIDLGSSKITSVSSEIDAQAKIEITSEQTSYSRGLSRAMITNSKEAENAILENIYSLENNSQKNIRNISVILNGANMCSHNISIKTKLSGRATNLADIKKILTKALTEFSKKNSDLDILHYFPTQYKIDNKYEILNPIGVTGKELFCKIHIITAPSKILLSIAECFAKCQLEISNFIVAPLANGLNCLTKNEKQVGALLIDIGAKSTNFGLFYQGKLIHIDYINIGGDHITNDIARAFSVSQNEAERLKIIYGSAQLNKNLQSEKIPVTLKNKERIMITAYDLNSVIIPRLEEIFELIEQKYKSLEFDKFIVKKIILCGGTSLLTNIRQKAELYFKRPTRLIDNNLERYSLEDNIYYNACLGSVINQANILEQRQLTAQNETPNFIAKWLKNIF